MPTILCKVHYRGDRNNCWFKYWAISIQSISSYYFWRPILILHSLLWLGNRSSPSSPSFRTNIFYACYKFRSPPSFWAYFSYFETVKRGLWDLLAVCLASYISPLLFVRRLISSTSCLLVCVSLNLFRFLWSPCHIKKSRRISSSLNFLYVPNNIWREEYSLPQDVFTSPLPSNGCLSAGCRWLARV
jgi:hypothetical protein